jgi:hypothetical protein
LAVCPFAAFIIIAGSICKPSVRSTNILLPLLTVPNRILIAVVTEFELYGSGGKIEPFPELL